MDARELMKAKGLKESAAHAIKDFITTNGDGAYKIDDVSVILTAEQRKDYEK